MNEWVPVSSIEASTGSKSVATWHDAHWCFQTFCLMYFVSMSYGSNLIVCVVVNLIQETLCGNFMDLCTFHVNNAELCK